MTFLHLAAGLALVLAATGPAHAQPPGMIACETQQELEQVIQSKGQIKPDGCRNLRIASVKTQVGELCQLEFQQPEDPGVVERLKRAVAPARWWVECAQLEKPVR
jgi:hypothetical protein